MTLPTSGLINIWQIHTEFGLGTSIATYRGVRWWTDAGATGTVPATGPISFADFYGKRGTSPRPNVTQTVSSAINKLDLFALFGNPTVDGDYTAIINVAPYSDTTAVAALTVPNSFTAGSVVTVIVNAPIYGMGGAGGAGGGAWGAPGSAGQSGGPALRMLRPLRIDNRVTIGGGGGGGAGGDGDYSDTESGVYHYGGGAGGGGASGLVSSAGGGASFGGSAGAAGTTSGPGAGGAPHGNGSSMAGRMGGSHGQPGGSFPGHTQGGAAGAAIIGSANGLTWIASGTILGPIQ